MSWKMCMFIIPLVVGTMSCSKNPIPPSSNSRVVDVDYRNGIYLIPYSNNFPNDLSVFVGLHPYLRITAMCAGSEMTYGHTGSVVLVTERR